MPSTIEVSRALAASAEDVGPLSIAAPEDQWYDRKSMKIAPATLARHIVAFANADGGVIVIGLSDGAIEGVDRTPDRMNELMQVHLQHCQPAVPLRASLVACKRGELDDHLLVLDIRAGETVYSTTRDEVYLRVGDESRKLSHQQRQELLFDRGQGSYEGRALEGAGFDALDEELLGSYTEVLEAPDARRLLRARGLATSDGLTVAGAVLFAAHPQSFLPEAFVRVLRYRGTVRGSGARQDLLHDERAEGPIPMQLDAARAAIMEHQPRRRALAASGRFEAIPLVPEEAWLEGLVNAVVHRSYSLAGDHIRVDIFSDRIEIESPGRFPGVFDARDPLGSPRYARNPRIARVCADLSFGQELGEGIRRMFDEMRLAGLAAPLYQQTQGSVRLTLVGEPVDRQLEARLPKETRAITAVLREGGALSTNEIAEAIGISRITARKRLEILREAGLVLWDGKSVRDPRASWRLPDG